MPRIDVILAGVIASGCTAPAPAPQWYGEIQPIVLENCAGCHVDGGIAPFPLTSYAEVSIIAQEVASSVEDRTMPPWPAAADCQAYDNDLSLTDAEIAAITAWADAGAPEGDPALAVSNDEESPSEELSRVDHTLGMTNPYLPTAQPDEFRCFVLDDVVENTYVTGLHVIPGNEAMVHHVEAFLVPPSQVATVEALDQQDDGEGYACMGTPVGDALIPLLGAWAPGGNTADFPDNTGIWVQTGSRIVLYMHYSTVTTPQPDQTVIELSTEDSVLYPASFSMLTNFGWMLDPSTMSILPGQTTTHEFVRNNSQPSVLHSVALHMHTLGDSGTLQLLRPSGDECLLDIPRWDFHWQRRYTFADPIAVASGDQLKISCTWTNDTENPVEWGERTNDEMCLGFVYETDAYE